MNVVGNKPDDFTLYEDDDVSDAYAKGEQNKIVLPADGDVRSVQRKGSYRGPERIKIIGWENF